MIIPFVLLLLTVSTFGMDDPETIQAANISYIRHVIDLWPQIFDAEIFGMIWEDPPDANLSSRCRKGLYRVANATDTAPLNYLRFFDSWGKPEPGIMYGNDEYWGYYQECIDLKETVIGETDFCTFSFISKFYPTKSTSTGVPYTFPFKVSLCLPHSCTTAEYASVIDLALIEATTRINRGDFFPIGIECYVDPDLTTQCPWRDETYNGGAIVFLVLCGILISLVLAGSSIDGYKWLCEEWLPTQIPDDKIKLDIEKPINTGNGHCGTKEDIASYGTINDDTISQPLLEKHIVGKNKLIEIIKAFLLCFSWYKTAPVIFSTKRTKDAITCISGIGALSMAWVILSRSYLVPFSLHLISDKWHFIDPVSTRFLRQLFTNSHSAYDSLFLLSGLLVSYSTLRRMSRQDGKLSVVKFYVHKFVHVVPIYYFMLFFFYKIFLHVAHGTNWNFREIHQCDDYWWTNALFINNFYPTEVHDTCYTATWFIAIEMQLFIFSPIFLYLLYYYWPIGLAAIAGTMSASWATIGAIAGPTEYNVNQLRHDMETGVIETGNVYYDIYYKPYYRANAYLIGITLGFVCFKKWKIPKLPLVRVPVYIGMVCFIISTMLAVVFGLYGTWHSHKFSDFENVFYFTFSGTGWSIAVALLIYICHTGFGFVVNTILSWSFWVPLYRLTISVYLIQVMTILFFNGTLQARFFYTDFSLIVYFSCHMVFSYSVAALTSTFVQYPVLNIEKLILKLCGSEEVTPIVLCNEDEEEEENK
ncbi:nose resistant to fluoxetine protein 6-like [Dysidea avara]|uniref:nose resistant to fluoxetine protein 6-like n=1 Tax=Dysidea avara TaxID=196820 RepID=UPI00332016B2